MRQHCMRSRLLVWDPCPRCSSGQCCHMCRISSSSIRAPARPACLSPPQSCQLLTTCHVPTHPPTNAPTHPCVLLLLVQAQAAGVMSGGGSSGGKKAAESNEFWWDVAGWVTLGAIIVGVMMMSRGSAPPVKA